MMPIPDQSRGTHFREVVASLGLKRAEVSTVQVNLGKLCNQTCLHCHVDAGPNKLKENMTSSTMDQLVRVLVQSPQVTCLDLTGGAPELNPGFRRLVETARGMGKHVIDRCNLTVLFEPGQSDLASFLANNGVEVVASLPCYLEDNVDQQRGEGVFQKSIAGLTLLNKLGYGKKGSGLVLNLVYNPLGPTLPPPEGELEAAYRKMLSERYGIEFNRLFTITNMPIKRFLYDLKKSGQVEAYMTLLQSHFNAAAYAQVMCRGMVSVGWDGRLYDCDFNQMLGMQLKGCHLADVESFAELSAQDIQVADHCFGCTAGSGSSCRGSLI